MAIIYPKNFDLSIIESHSEAEYIIFREFLKLDKEKTKDWVIYYSYSFKRKGMVKSSENTYIKQNNEIDFLILVPDVGIMVFEIKGGKIIDDPNGEFISINRYTNEQTVIKPFKQSKDNYYALSDLVGSIYDSISGKYKEIKNFAGAQLVGFPNIDVKPTGFLQSNGNDIYVSGTDLYEFLINSVKYANRGEKPVPSKKVIEQIINKLNGEKFYYNKDRKIYIDSIKLSIDKLTEEQETVFKGLLSNKRCLIKGTAGTGKTVLCEFLYKHLYFEKKNSVIYFTYNTLISKKLENDLSINGESKCFPIFEYLEKEYEHLTGENLSKFDTFEEKKTYLFKNISKLIESKSEAEKFDCLILDEAQDIDLNDDIILFFDSLINGGLDNGRCYIFYDDNQKLFDPKRQKIYDSYLFSDSNNGYRYANFELLRNCRNSNGVIHCTNNILDKKEKSNNLNDVYKEIENEDVKYTIVNNSIECAIKIRDLIKTLIDKNKSGVNKEQITLLFNRKKDNNPIYNELSKYFIIDDFNPKGNKNISFATVKGFKGLENDIIIYVNDNVYSKHVDHYVAASRAKALVYIFQIEQNIVNKSY